MFSLALLIGVYSYLIFCLGILGFLSKENVIVITLIFLVLIVFFGREKIKFKKIDIPRQPKWLIWILFLIVIVNLIGALGPELGFDALWYHLTLPKIFLMWHKIEHIPGGLLYYSDMPKLGEILYISALSFGNEILAKIIHFSFGVLVLVALYKLSRIFLDKKFSLIAVLIFYSNLVVDWQSTTAYVDLIRTFFETMALWAFLNFEKTKKQKWLVESAVMVGLAISAKLLALGSLVIFIFLLVIMERKISKNPFIFSFISILISSPWFIFSYINTGNPVYPFFTKFYDVPVSLSLFNPVRFLSDTIFIFTRSADPISPLYLIFLPVSLLLFRKFNHLMKMILLYSILSIIVWYFTPRTGGGRFLMPYLPAFSLITSFIVFSLPKDLKRFSISLIIIVSLISLVYRGLANYRYLKFDLGLQSKSQFLTNNLNFSYGNFFDTDGYFKKHIKNSDKVLLYGFHNLYYVDFPFIDSSYVKGGDKFNYIAVQNSKLPSRFSFWREIYSNPKTGVRLYSLGGQEWVY